MWRNREVADFVDWLRRHNEGAERNAGFYGLDLYSMHRSMEAVIAYLEDVDPEAAKRARERYSCFDHFGPDPQVYAYEASLGGAEPCERQALEQLLELHALGDRLVHIKEDEQFFAEQNARLVVDAEEYFRAMFRGGRVAWNLRARHMVETLEALVDHLQQSPEPPKLVVWAHNSHLGDARATEMGRHGELNVGQFLRERHGERAFLAGFSTYTGTVTAASDWGGPAERKHVRPALAGSWEDRFHRAGEARMLVDAGALSGHRLERAIGVIYRPETERVSHYFHAWLAAQFDAIMHIDETTAIEPLERTSGWDAADLPETYPYGV
jgi:erythromycin esterase-like protein